jgi:predicted HicB family RNase H-like nuclease
MTATRQKEKNLKTFILRIPEPLKDKILARAKEQNTSQANIIVQALKEVFNNEIKQQHKINSWLNRSIET